MKKAIAILLVTALSVALASCTGDGINTLPATPSPFPTATTTPTPTPTPSPSPTATPTPTPTPEPVPTVLSEIDDLTTGNPVYWITKNYIDEFNKPTDEQYVGYKEYIRGTFSNSATNNSKLLVAPLVDADSAAFLLLEYERNPVVNSSTRSDEQYDVTILLPDDTRQEATGWIYTGGDRIVFEGRNMDTIVSALSGEGPVSFYIVQTDRPTTTYLFSMEASNFAEVYALLIE